MKAVFVTTFPNDVANVIAAWDCWNEVKSERIIFDFRQVIDDADILRRAEAASPDVIFYVGGCGGPMHLPTIATLQALKEMAPSINLIFDGIEDAWYEMIAKYKQHECFNLQVTIDGCPDAPVDLVTTAPVDTRLFAGEDPPKDIPCGISGNIGRGDKRSKIINPLIWEGLVEMRRRDVVGDGFPEHVAFMRRCQMIINTSFTGSGNKHHVKQRVFETGFAGAALLECEAAPTHFWIPQSYFFRYKNTLHASQIIKTLDAREIAEKGQMLQQYVRAHYMPEQVYGAMLDRL
jgi:hypothetical protein